MIIRILLVSLFVSILAACSGTTVVLVPDAKGKVGQVDVTTKVGTTRLSKANESAEAVKSDKAPSAAVQLSADKINDMFGQTLAKEPMAPEHIVLYFSTGSAELLPNEAAKLENAKSAIKLRNSCDISVIGHSDTVGDYKLNQGISDQRAENVKAALIGLGADGKCMDTRYYGESDLAVPTADNVDEPQNRRVEVEIR